MKFETMADGRVRCPFDHHSPEFAASFFDIFDEMRQKSPLAWSDFYGGFWIATGHDVVRRLTVNSAAVSVAPGPEFKGGIIIPPDATTKVRPRFVPGEAEGPDHDRYRLALNPHFSKQRVVDMSDVIERHVGEAIKRITDLGAFDVISDFIFPILSGVACEHLGLEAEDESRFFHACAKIVSAFGDGAALTDIQTEFGAAWAIITTTVAARRAEPRDDVISYLVAWNDHEFTDREVQMMTLNVILGAAETTSAMIGQAVMFLAEHEDVRTQLAENPDLVRPAVEEFLRLFAVAMGPCRTMTQEVEIEGVTLRVGDRIMMAFPAANHDPEQYPNPYNFDLTRGSRRHLAMGVGTHFCLGSHLAKAISEESLKQLLQQAPNFRVDAANAHSNADKSASNGWETIPAFME